MGSYANEVPTFGALTNVSVEKLQDLDTVLAKLLDLPIARDTYAQIIDGKPTHAYYSERTSHIISGNPKPSDRATQEYEKVRKTFAAQDLVLDLKLAQEYQNAPSDSRENRLRILQIAAASVNAIARKLYLDFHPDTNTRPSKPPRGHGHQFNELDEFYVNFYHLSYRAFERYPFGLLDVVGYWAEAELFGGVVLFEREQPGSNITNVFLHPQTAGRTFQLSENQVECFSRLREVGESARTVLPFAKEANARTELTYARAGEAPLRIYKNEYDKPPVSTWPKRKSCVIKQGDQGDPRAASLENAMKVIVEKGWDKKPIIVSGPLPTVWSVFETNPTAGEASSSSKDDPPEAEKRPTSGSGKDK